MNANQRWTRLRRDRPLRMTLEAGGRVVVGRGLVWLTLADDVRDHYVAAGGEFRAVRRADIVVQALQRTATVAVYPPAQQCRHRAALASFFRALLDSPIRAGLRLSR